MKSVEFKSAKHDELIQIGYGILGTVEDQWSDLDVSRNGIQVKIPNYLYQNVY